jgi:hypothetical protein
MKSLAASTLSVLTAIVLAALAVSCAAGPADEAPVAATSAAVDSSGATTLIARKATWFLWYDGVDRGTYWRQQGWQPEPGVTSATVPVGYGESYISNTLSYGPDPAHKPITGYFRKAFYVADPAQLGRVELQLMFDDGMVFYINGQEIGRDSMPAGPVSYGTLAYSHEANATYVAFDASAGVAQLVPGWNTLAIEIHQESPASSDLVFDAALVAYPRASGDATVARGARWSFREDGVMVAGWNQPGFDDSSWASAAGPLGYGETYVTPSLGYGADPAHKPRAAYFRHVFTLADPARVTGLFADVMFDDGFVAYLNGHEIGRDFMAAGAVDATTLAWNHAANDAYVPYDWSAALPYLVAGDNVLAFEVHQTSEASSDLVFDASLQLQTGGLQ